MVTLTLLFLLNRLPCYLVMPLMATATCKNAHKTRVRGTTGNAERPTKQVNLLLSNSQLQPSCLPLVGCMFDFQASLEAQITVTYGGFA